MSSASNKGSEPAYEISPNEQEVQQEEAPEMTLTDGVSSSIMNNLSTSSIVSTDSSAGNYFECSDDDHRFVPLRRVGSYPLPSAPPKRPIRSSSLERQDDEQESGDEYDHQKFRQLLLGSNADGSMMNCNGGDHGLNTCDETFATPQLCSRKSSSSAPPKIPHRQGSYNEQERKALEGARPRASCARQQSLPLIAFQPKPVHCRHRRRSRIQEMLCPDSEGSSKSLRLPPRLPSRTGSDSEKQGKTLTTQPQNTGAIPTNVLVLFPRTSSAAAVCTTATSAIPRSKSEEAPKRPRRSLSPDVSGISMRSLIEMTLNDVDDHINSLAAPETSKETKKDELPVAATPSSNVSRSCSATTAKKRRQLPGRAKTFQEKSLSAGQRDTCISLLSMNLKVGRDFRGTPVCSPDQQGSLASLLPGTSTWPKAPRTLTRVLPGRSRTFTNH